MNDKDVLVAIISGKRPGSSKERPTENFDIKFKEVIVSNNSEGYETDLEIINIPKDFENWYKENVKTNDKSFYAPMNRTYAMKYAKMNGYRYLVQLDDNIQSLEIAYINGEKAYRTTQNNPHKEEMMQRTLEFMKVVLEETNAGIVGVNLNEASVPSNEFIRERFVYSLFMMDLERVPDLYHGDFEDDIEFRYKMKQNHVPMLKINPIRYSKISQGDKDTTGNRAAYNDAGVERGDTVAKIYGELFARGTSTRGSGTRRTGKEKFRHKMKPFKVGAMVNDWERVKQEFREMAGYFAETKEEKIW